MKRVMIVGLIGVTALNGMNEQIIPMNEKYAISRESYKQYYKEFPSNDVLNTMDILSDRVRELDKKKPLTPVDINHYDNNHCNCSFKLEPVNRGENVLLIEALPMFLLDSESPRIHEYRCVCMLTGFERTWLLKRTSGHKSIPLFMGAIMYQPICPGKWCKDDIETCNFLENKKAFAIEYYLRSEGRHRGIMSAAVAELINFIKHFETGDDGYDYLIARIFATNKKAKAVVERAEFKCISDQHYQQIWAYQLQ